MKTNNPTPKCPYCGAEMKPDRTFKSMLPVGTPATFWWMCGECSATSPKRETGEFAYAAAMRRYEEPNRVLALEELDKADSERSLYFETREPWSGGEVFESSVECAQETFCDGDESNDARKEYGVTVRCWLRRPTDAEREASPWKN